MADVPDVHNSGCDSNDGAGGALYFQDVGLGGTPVTICGLTGAVTWYHSTWKDRDWFRVVLVSPATLEATLDTEFPSKLSIARVADITSSVCQGVEYLQTIDAVSPCTPTRCSALVPAGTYYVRVGPAYDDYTPCDWRYVLTLAASDATTPARRSTWARVKAHYR